MDRQVVPKLFAFEKDMFTLFATIQFAGTGVPVLLFWQPNIAVPSSSAFVPAGTTAGPVGAPAGAKGIQSITRTGVGTYVLTLQGTFQHLLGGSVLFDTSPVGAATAAVAPIFNLTVNTPGVTATPQLTLLLQSAAGTPADPASGEVGYFTFQFSNTSAV